MKIAERVMELRRMVYDNLRPYMDQDYIYLDCPYHQNIGDILIWEGTEYFLRSIPHKCLYKASKDTYRHQDIGSDVTIFMHGGGNWGDVWPYHHDFRKQIMREYPENRIVCLPQTVQYSDDEMLMQDAEEMSNHKNLIVCARDKRSYDILNGRLSNRVIMVPDMAFCIDRGNLSGKRETERNRDVIVVRADKELANVDYKEKLPKGATVDFRDWPPYEHREFKLILFLRMLKYKKLLPYSWIDNYADTRLRPYLVDMGVEFLSSYRHIYTTRLHAAILSMLLDKEFTIFDNSYGKNSTFVDTWLEGVEGIELIR